jgi:glycosyltransferase involved in cell wall biosynthesis
VDTELIVLLWTPDPVIDAALARVSKSGVRVQVIARRPGGPSLLSRLVRDLDCWRRLSVYLRGRGNRVIHMHMELLMQVLAARFAGCRRLVMSIHNDEPLYRRPALRVWFGTLVGWGVRFVAITDHLRQYLIGRVGLPAGSVTTIHYGVPVPASRPLTRAEFGLHDGDFVVGFVGRLTAQKNVPLLIRAMALRPDVKCLIVGDGELRPELQRLAAELGCANVTFTGAVPDAARIMPLFDVFCLPSIWEGLGVVLLEAMLQDVPIIGSRAGAIPEVLDQGTCGVLIDPASVASLVAAIDALHADPDRRKAFATTARAYALSEYTVRRMGTQTCDLYCELIENTAQA